MTERERLIRLRVERTAYTLPPTGAVERSFLGRSSAEDDIRYLLDEIEDLREQVRQAARTSEEQPAQPA